MNRKRRPPTVRRTPMPTPPYGINVGVILQAIIGSLVIFAISRQCSKSDDAKTAAQSTQMKVELSQKDIAAVQTGVSDLKSEVKQVQHDVSDAKSQMVTKSELTQNHQDLQNSISNVWGAVNQLRSTPKK